ncbi:MAG: hypothetical protein CL528_06915 [Aequorivita sp.]|nr:hypothetical protein [Aequorivita sp.]
MLKIFLNKILAVWINFQKVKSAINYRLCTEIFKKLVNNCGEYNITCKPYQNIQKCVKLLGCTVKQKVKS